MSRRVAEETAAVGASANAVLEDFPVCVGSSEPSQLLEFIEAHSHTDAIHVACAEGRNAAFFAAQRPDAEAVPLLAALRAAGLQLGVEDANGQTALFYAARDGNLGAMELLIKDGGLAVDPVDFADQSAVYYAAREGRSDVVRWLVARGADVNRLDANGDPPLFYAARDGRSDTVHAMVELGADPNTRNKMRQSATSIARKHGHKALAAELEALAKGAGAGGGVATGAQRKGRRGGAAGSRPNREREDDVAQQHVERKRRRLECRKADGEWQGVDDEQLEAFEKMFPKLALWLTCEANQLALPKGNDTNNPGLDASTAASTRPPSPLPPVAAITSPAPG